MTLQQVELVLESEPFVPLRLYKSDGTSVDIPFRHVAVPLRSQGLLVFKGVKDAQSRVAKSYEVIDFSRIERLEQRPGRGGAKRKKAS